MKLSNIDYESCNLYRHYFSWNTSVFIFFLCWNIKQWPAINPFHWGGGTTSNKCLILTITFYSLFDFLFCYQRYNDHKSGSFLWNYCEMLERYLVLVYSQDIQLFTAFYHWYGGTVISIIIFNKVGLRLSLLFVTSKTLIINTIQGTTCDFPTSTIVCCYCTNGLL